jgi:hypothetical protein
MHCGYLPRSRHFAAAESLSATTIFHFATGHGWHRPRDRCWDFAISAGFSPIIPATGNQFIGP